MALAKRPTVHGHDSERKHVSTSYNGSWPSSSGKMRSTSLIRKRRIFLIVAIICFIYLFIHYLPTDVPSVGRRIDYRTGLSQGRPFPFDPSLTLEHQQHGVKTDKVYDGPVKFYHLAGSLRTHAQNRHAFRDNVLFVLYDLSSTSTVLNMACAMARYDRNDVHIGLLAARDESIEDIMSINGIKQEDCPVFWHDARPDHNGRSSTKRQEIAVQAALTHMHAALQYSVVLVDERQIKSQSLQAVLRTTLDAMWLHLQVISKEGMEWVAALDGQSLKALSNMQIDIVIQPYRHSAGSLIRLLESIRKANYGSLPVPRIIVDIPHDIDSFALRYLEHFRWPSDTRIGQSKLVLRRHLHTAALSPALASLRTIEAFYPPSQPLSHVLVLSPDVELTSNYLQYLYFITLEYKYSQGNQQTSRQVSGVSLHTPNVLFDGQMPFVTETSSKVRSLLMHQAPTSTAALWFGDKWTELQDYVSLRLQQDPELKKKVSTDLVYSATHPAWLRLASEFMQAGNYFMVYPNFEATPDTRLATVHTEISQRPEEYWEEPTQPAETKIPALKDDTVLSGDMSAQVPDELPNSMPSLSIPALLGMKNFEPPPIDLTIPLVSFKGQPVDELQSRQNAKAYVDRLSIDVGGCAELSHRDSNKLGIAHVFCDT